MLIVFAFFFTFQNVLKERLLILKLYLLHDILNKNKSIKKSSLN